MSLVEKWSAIVAGCEEGEAAHNYEGQWAVMSGARGAAFAECMRDLEAACTPRPPKAEWFGAPYNTAGAMTGKWDAWMVQDKDGHWFVFCRTWRDGRMIFAEGSSASIRAIAACLPITRDGTPVPVGWSVVGG